MKVLLVLSVMALVQSQALAQGSGESGEPGESGERPRILCGRVLADARLLYCYSSEVQKRSSESPLIVPLYPRQQNAVWPWLAQQHQRQQQQRSLALRGKRDPGLVDECCLKPCYVSELLNYC